MEHKRSKMNTIKLKTNINCSGCVRAVTPQLDNSTDIQRWAVDTEHPDKILSVDTETLDAASVILLVQKSGFRAEIL